MDKRFDGKLSIVIPCLNESATIERAVSEALKNGKKFLKVYEVIVSDNGSTDGSLEKLIRIKNIKIIRTPIKGYGAALHYAILSAKYPFVLFADADLSYDFGQINKFLPVINKNYDLILGSRFKSNMTRNAMPFLNRYVGTPLLTFLIRIVYGIKTSDCNSGMRVVKKSFYQKLNMRNSGMEWASELLIKTILYKGKYKEVAINFQKDLRGGNSHLKRWEDGWRHLKVIVLLKPILLLQFTLIFAVTGIIFMGFSHQIAISLFLFAEFFFLSYLITKRIESAISGVPNRIAGIIDRIPLVLIAVVISFLGFIQIFTIPDKYFIFKFIFLFQVILYNMWLFFIETIKTHLVNSLTRKF